MKLIVGLGNPGTKYEKTRHNLGFMVVEQFFKDFEPVDKTVWEDSDKFKSDIAQFSWQRRSLHNSSGQAKQELVEKVILVKPKTFMNNSGLAVQLLTTYYKLLPPEADQPLAGTTDLWVVHDDVDLPLGTMKIRFGGASAGHRGMESIMRVLATDKFWRFRLGIGHPKQGHYQLRSIKGVDDYVLGLFSPAERGKVRELIKRGAKALALALEEGLEVAQNRFNTH